LVSRVKDCVGSNSSGWYIRRNEGLNDAVNCDLSCMIDRSHLIRCSDLLKFDVPNLDVLCKIRIHNENGLLIFHPRWKRISA
jgi:hypothetical protein